MDSVAMLRNNRRRIVLWSGAVVALALSAPLWYGTGGQCPVVGDARSNLTSQAHPQFARKYNMDCACCHQTPNYQFTRGGFIFRRLGYRFPYEIERNEHPNTNMTGKEVWEREGCFACHPGGGNTVNPRKPLKGARFLAKYPGDSMGICIRGGIPGTGMPPFPASQINDVEMKRLVDYIKTFTKS